jgi:hypothetical protein
MAQAIHSTRRHDLPSTKQLIAALNVVIAKIAVDDAHKVQSVRRLDQGVRELQRLDAAA